MNKKIFMFAIPLLLMIGLVAAVSYYALFSVTINVTQPISIDGELEQSVDCDTGETCEGNDITITNSGENERELNISSETDDGISVLFKSELNLTNKIVDFEDVKWDINESGNIATVEFTIVGDEFSAEIVSGELSGYELIYYKDNSERFDNPAQATKLADIEGNLPYSTDGNADEYDYCTTGEYDTCHGAKLWYVPSDAIDGSDNLDWSRADEFLFETALIQFNSDGKIIIYGNSELVITPVYTIDKCLESGEYNASIIIA